MTSIEKRFTVVCIGGMNIDRKFYAKSELQYETSNPVTSSYSAGGVARNIAENLGRLGENVIFLSASGQDGDWELLKETSKSYMDLSYVKTEEDFTTGNYTAVLDKKGDLVIALADMDVFDEITPQYIKKYENIIKKADSIVIDLNCPKETVEYTLQFGKKNEIPIFIIPVSSPKMDRLPKDLSNLSWLIVNKDESETFLNMSIEDRIDWERAVEKWLQLGIKNVIVTNGAQGVMAGSKDRKVTYFPAIPTPEVVDVTGAGDSFCSAVIHMWLHNHEFSSIIKAGMINAHRTIMSPYTVRLDLNREKLLTEMKDN